MKTYLNHLLLVATSVVFFQECCAGLQTNSAALKQDTSLPNTNSEEYQPILYDLKYAKETDVCESLLQVVNHDLKTSQYVDYSNTDYFVSWQFQKGGKLASSGSNFKRKDWVLKYEPPMAKNVIDIDNDGNQEYLYIHTHLIPYASQRILVLKNQTENQPVIDKNPVKQTENFYAFLKEEREHDNLKYDIDLRRATILDELSNYSRDQHNDFRFVGRDAAFFIYKYYGKNYLVADNLSYEIDSDKWYKNDPWYLLFSVQPDGQLEKTCILKRQQ